METIKHLEQENHTLRDLSLSSGSGNAASGAGDADQDVSRKDRERHVAKELKLLKRTIEEMELRIDTQKQTLATRDESIRKLMDMLQAKGWYDHLRYWIIVAPDTLSSPFVCLLARTALQCRRAYIFYRCCFSFFLHFSFFILMSNLCCH